MPKKNYEQDPYHLFQKRLKAARKQAGLTQEQLAAAAGFSPVTLSKLETGVNKPTYDIFMALAAALNVSPNFLTGWDDAKTSGNNASRRLLLNELTLTVDGLSDEWLKQLIAVARLAHRQ